jgi:hypothetical protein
MSTIERAWSAFTSAINEARELNERGARTIELAELTRHARELLDIIEVEIAEQSIAMSRDARKILAQMRDRLESLEKDVSPTRH